MKNQIEKRKNRRIDCIRNFGLTFTSYYIEVCDRRTGEIIGRLEDISAGGMRVFSGKPIETNRVYSLKLTIMDEQGARPIEFEARSVWCNHEVNSHFYHTGFRFTSGEGTRSGLFESVRDGIRD